MAKASTVSREKEALAKQHLSKAGEELEKVASILYERAYSNISEELEHYGGLVSKFMSDLNNWTEQSAKEQELDAIEADEDSTPEEMMDAADEIHGAPAEAKAEEYSGAGTAEGEAEEKAKEATPETATKDDAASKTPVEGETTAPGATSGTSDG